MLELVGDTYNPDFVPSAYEEYVTYRIKESVLPSDLPQVAQEFPDVKNKTEESYAQLHHNESTPIDLSNPLVGIYLNQGVGNAKPEIYYLRNFYTKDISVTPGELYQVSGMLGGSSMAQIAFYDSNNICVGVVNKGSTEEAGQIKTELVTIPSDAVLMCVCSRTDYSWYVNKISYVPYNLSGLEDLADIKLNSENAISRKYKIKLLLIGSSHGMNTIAQLPWMAYKSGFDIEVGNVYIGSLSLQRLVGYIQRNENISFKLFKNGAWTTINNMKFADVAAYTNWDFISLQRSASDDEIWLSTQNEADTEQNAMTDINYGISGSTPVYMSHTDALQFILNRITEAATNRPNIIFNSGFADASDQPTSSATPNIISSVKKMKDEFGIEFYSTAIAIRNARNTYLRNLGDNGYHNLCYDSQHLDYGIGCWVVSAALLEFVLRKLGWDIETINTFGTQEELATFVSVATPENYTLPTSETMSIAKACAKAAYNKNDNVTEALTNRFKWQVLYIIIDGITLSNTKGYSANEDIYTTTITGASSVIVTMGGTNITDSVYDNGNITIGSVTGDVIITAN